MEGFFLFSCVFGNFYIGPVGSKTLLSGSKKKWENIGLLKGKPKPTDSTTFSDAGQVSQVSICSPSTLHNGSYKLICLKLYEQSEVLYTIG